MNLNAIVAGTIGAINPQVTLAIAVSTGFTQSADGTQIPTYASAISVPGQVQPLTTGDIAHLNSLNIQGAQRRIYINGIVNGLVRASNKGGDLITTPDGNVWLVLAILEAWGVWTAAAVVLQDGS
jgi:ABC-type oligopeptide transport system substrate-binding subunit